FSKKEIARLERERKKLEKNLAGIKDMTNLPEALFVIDTKRESIAIQEARRLGIPIIGVADTNCDPDEIDYIIPGNDDALRAIRLISSTIAQAYLDGTGVYEAQQKEIVAQQERQRQLQAQAAAAQREAAARAAEARARRGEGREGEGGIAVEGAPAEGRPKTTVRKTLQRKVKPKSGTSPKPEGEGLVDLQPETAAPEGEPVEAAPAPQHAHDAGPVFDGGA